jgi:HAD superfamily hydrolase (TIGR01509 family)
MKHGEDLHQLLQGKRLLIFDFDGTVADTSPLHAAAFAQVLAPLGIAVDYPALAGLKTLDAMRICLTGAGRSFLDGELNEMVNAKQLLVRQMIAKNLAPLPGVDEFLRWARPRYRLSMATSGSRGTVQLALEKLGYLGWFDPLICADDVCHAKPHPEGFLSVLQITGIQASDALVFEDSAAGLAAAATARLDYCDVRTGSWTRLTDANPCNGQSERSMNRTAISK